MGGSEGATALVPEDEQNEEITSPLPNSGGSNEVGTLTTNIFGPLKSHEGPEVAPPEQKTKGGDSEGKITPEEHQNRTNIGDPALSKDVSQTNEEAVPQPTAYATTGGTEEQAMEGKAAGEGELPRRDEQELPPSANTNIAEVGVVGVKQEAVAVPQEEKEKNKKNEEKGKEPTSAGAGQVAEVNKEEEKQPESEECSSAAPLNPMFVLAHFCELHGPSVLLCTQLIRSTSPSACSSSPPGSSSSSASTNDEQEQEVDNTRPGAAATGDPVGAAKRCMSPPTSRWAFPLAAPAGASFALSSSNSPILKVNAASSAILPTDSIKTAASSSGRRSAPACPSCNALASDSGFFSVDHDNGTYFITTRYPSATYARIRTACVRALSCEFSPGREGPMFFGDEENGFCLSYVFKVHDLQARGFVRWYGILFLAPHASLLASTDFLVGSVKGIVKDLHDQSVVILEKEKQEKERQAQSAQVSAASSSGGGMNALHSRTNFPTGPGAFRRRQIHANAPLRGLDALISDKNLPGKLHSSFTWILQQWERQNLASPLMPFRSVNALSSNSSSSSSSGTASSSSTSSTSGVSLGNPSSPVFSFISSICSLSTDNEPLQMRGEASEHVLVFESLQQLMHALGARKFDALLYNVLCGNQVIVRGECRPLVASVLALLTGLVPERCVKIKGWETDEYHESWKFNFLGVSWDVSVPEYIPLGSYALVDILPHRLAASAPRASSSSSSSSHPSASHPRIRSYHSSLASHPPPSGHHAPLLHQASEPALLFTPHRGAATTHAPPSSPSDDASAPIASMHSSVSSPVSSAASSDHPSTPQPRVAGPAAPSSSVPGSPCGVNAWTSYRYDCQAKVEGVVGNLPAEVVGVLGLRLPPHLEVQRLQAIKHAWSSKAKAFFAVSKTMESERDVRLQTFLTATGLLEADLPILRYWTTGLRHCALLRLIATQPSMRPGTVSVPFVPARTASFGLRGGTLLPQGSSFFSRTTSIYTLTT